MKKDKEQIKAEAKKDAEKMFESIKVVYKEQTIEYIRHFYNRLSELRAEMD
jgi:hypothetical protein